MRWGTKLVGIEIVLAILSGLSLPVYAEGNIHIGSLEINPFASVEQKYDDNIFLEPDNQENDDWITTTTLGFGANMPLVAEREEDFMLKARYTADIIEFWDDSEQDRVDHAVSALADFKFVNDFTLKLEEDFKKTADPPNSELTALEKRLRNISRVVLGYKREKIGIDLGYRDIRDDYDNLDSLDRREDVITTTAYFQLFPKTSLFGEYNYGKIVYDNNDTNSDSDYSQWRLGLRGEIAPKLTGIIKAGYKSAAYNDSSKDDFEGFTIFGNLIYRLKERSSLNIYGERGSIESAYRTNSYFESNVIGLGLDHQLLEKLFLVGGVSYQLNKYPDTTQEGGVRAKRRDYIWDAKLGLRYEMKDWVIIETDYEYKQRDSKFAAFDYEDNRATTKISLLF